MSEERKIPLELIGVVKLCFKTNERNLDKIIDQVCRTNSIRCGNVANYAELILLIKQ